LKFSDEVIVVHGGKTNEKGGCPSLDYIRSLQEPRLRILTFPWPEDFEWRQIARTCTFGHLHARGQWCFRVLADEIFPDDFIRIREYLKKLPSDKKIVSVDRLYMLGNKFACAFHGKPLFFRNDKSIGFGSVNPAQGDAASYGLFDDPIETDRWFDGDRVISLFEQSIIRDPKGQERLMRGETPVGFRGESTSKMTSLFPVGVLNVDVNFHPDDALLSQKDMSQNGYQRLPPEYPRRPVLSRAQLGATLEYKIHKMIKTGKLYRVSLPETLHQFVDRKDAIQNRVRHLCEYEYGLPWNRLAGKARKYRCVKTILRNKLNNLRWKAI